MSPPRTCTALVGCTALVVCSLVIARLPSAGPGRNVWIAACPAHHRAVGNGASVHVGIDPDDRGRRRPRVVLGR